MDSWKRWQERCLLEWARPRAVRAFLGTIRTRTATKLAGAILAAASGAGAEPGALTQAPGIEGCISEDGSGGCRDARVFGRPTAMNVGPGGRQVYVGFPDTTGIAVLARDRTTGALEQLPGTDGCITESGHGGECATGRALTTIFRMAFSPDGRHAYAAAQFSDAIDAFERNRTTGALRQLPGTQGCIAETGNGGLCTDGRGLEAPQSVAVSPDGRNVYATAGTSGALSVFARDKATGVLTQLPGLEGCLSHDGSGGECAQGRALRYAGSAIVSGDGKHVYVASASHGVAAFARSRSTGALTQLPGLAGCIRDELLGDPECATARQLGYAGTLVGSEDGKFVYVGASDGIAVFARNRTTGALTQLPGLDGCVSLNGTGGACAYGKALDVVGTVALSPDGRQLYAAAAHSNAVAVFARSKTTGALTQLPGLEGCLGQWGNDGLCTEGRALLYSLRVEASPDGRHVYATGPNAHAVAVLQRER